MSTNEPDFSAERFKKEFGFPVERIGEYDYKKSLFMHLVALANIVDERFDSFEYHKNDSSEKEYLDILRRYNFLIDLVKSHDKEVLKYFPTHWSEATRILLGAMQNGKPIPPELLGEKSK